MLTKWCLQSNLNVTESSKIAESCEILGYPCILGKVIPFSGKCPRFKVVECNCLNMAGFYQNDHMQIVRAVSEYQLDQFNAGKSHQNFFV